MKIAEEQPQEALTTPDGLDKASGVPLAEPTGKFWTLPQAFYRMNWMRFVAT